MHRRLPGLAALAVLGIWAAACGADSPAAPMAQAKGADVRLVTIDTLRADAVGFAGGFGAGRERVETPVLDRLAAGAASTPTPMPTTSSPSPPTPTS